MEPLDDSDYVHPGSGRLLASKPVHPATSAEIRAKAMLALSYGNGNDIEKKEAALREIYALVDVDPSCTHGTAWYVHCCNCHSGFIFDLKHECPTEPRSSLEQVLSPAASRDVDGDQMFSLTCANCGRQTDDADHDHGCPEIDQSIERAKAAMDRHTVYALSSRSTAPDTVEVIASFVEHLRDGHQSTTEPVSKVARLIRERFGKR